MKSHFNDYLRFDFDKKSILMKLLIESIKNKFKYPFLEYYC